MFVEKWGSMCHYVLHVMFCLRTVSLDVDPHSSIPSEGVLVHRDRSSVAVVGQGRPGLSDAHD